jgi:hypothetical protein
MPRRTVVSGAWREIVEMAYPRKTDRPSQRSLGCHGEMTRGEGPAITPRVKGALTTTAYWILYL